MNCPICQTSIDEHEANQCLDAWIATDVFGGTGWEKTYIAFATMTIFPLPYSTDVAAAWQIVEKLHENGSWMELHSPFGYGEEHAAYWVGFTPHLTTGWNGKPDHWTPAPTAPLAICRAALKAVEYERTRQASA